MPNPIKGAIKWLLDPRKAKANEGKKNLGAKQAMDDAAKRKAEKKRLLDEAGNIRPKK